MIPALLVLLAWGVLSFGAVYPWAYTPLLIGCGLIGVYGLYRGQRTEPRLLVPALLAFLGAALLQLVPLPQPLLQTISPATDRVLESYVVHYPEGGPHALSLRPDRSVVAIAAFSALALLLVGLIRWFSTFGTRGLGMSVAAIGLLVATTAIVQRSSGVSQIYGFWTPIFKGDFFGPFVNRHHFAGWMIMAIPLVLAEAGAVIAAATASVRGRRWLEWMSSGQAVRLSCLVAALLVMIVAVVLSASRSGILGLAVATAIAAYGLIRAQRSISGRLLGLALVAVAAAGAAAWGRPDVVEAQFSGGSGALGWRWAVWLDALAVIRDFPLTGTGLNTYGDAMFFYQRVPIDAHFVQAHNDYLQLAAEGGLLLMIPALLLLALIAVTAVQRFRDSILNRDGALIRLGAVAGLSGIAFQEAVDFSLQMPGNAVLCVTLIALALHRRRSLEPVRVTPQ